MCRHFFYSLVEFWAIAIHSDDDDDHSVENVGPKILEARYQKNVERYVELFVIEIRIQNRVVWLKCACKRYSAASMK